MILGEWQGEHAWRGGCWGGLPRRRKVVEMRSDENHKIRSGAERLRKCR